MVEVSLVVVPQTEVVRMVREDLETDVKTTMMDVDPAVGRDRETPEETLLAQVEEEEVPPPVQVTTVDEGLVDVPSWPTSWIGW